MINYSGIRVGHVVSVVVSTPEGPKDLRHICRHSPDGFQWGYGGSGPSDLALSIMTDHFSRQGVMDATKKANTCYQDFKWMFIANVTGNRFVITEEQINEWIKKRGRSTDADIL